MNKDHRLGKKGAGWVDGWCGNHYSSNVIREDFRLYIENIDVSDQKFTGKAEHGYFLMSWMVDIYEATATGGYLYYELGAICYFETLKEPKDIYFYKNESVVLYVYLDGISLCSNDTLLISKTFFASGNIKK